MGVIKRGFYRLSIVSKIAATLFLIATLSILIVTLLHIWQTKHTIDSLVRDFIAVNIEGSEDMIIKSIFADDRWALYKFVKSISDNNFVTEIGLIAPDNRVIVHTDTARWRMDSVFGWPAKPDWIEIELSGHDGVVGTFVVRKNSTHLDGLIMQIIQRGVGIFLLLSLLSIAAGVFISGRIVGRLKVLLSHIDAILDKKWEKVGSVHFDEQDEITRILDAFYEMARELQNHIQKLGETNHFYHEILSQIDTTILICDLRFKPLFSNKTPAIDDRIDPALEALLADRKLLGQIGALSDGTLQKELRLQGRLRAKNLVATVAPLEDRLLITFANITRVRELEEQFLTAQTLSLVGQLSAALAHELKNLIVPLRLLLSDEEVPSPEDLRIIRTTTDKLNRLITGFLNFAKPPSQDERNWVRLADLIDETQSLLAGRLAGAHLHLSISLDRDLKANLSAKGFEIVLINLLLNAIDASSPGDTLSVSLFSSESGRFRLSVADEGSGIEPAILERIHEPFFTTKTDGTGLGLSTVYRIVYDMGGQIDVKSGSEGTCFDIEIPIDKEL